MPDDNHLIQNLAIMMIWSYIESCHNDDNYPILTLAINIIIYQLHN